MEWHRKWGNELRPGVKLDNFGYIFTQVPDRREIRDQLKRGRSMLIIPGEIVSNIDQSTLKALGINPQDLYLFYSKEWFEEKVSAVNTGVNVNSFENDVTTDVELFNIEPKELFILFLILSTKKEFIFFKFDKLNDQHDNDFTVKLDFTETTIPTVKNGETIFELIAPYSRAGEGQKVKVIFCFKDAKLSTIEIPMINNAASEIELENIPEILTEFATTLIASTELLNKVQTKASAFITNLAYQLTESQNLYNISTSYGEGFAPTSLDQQEPVLQMFLIEVLSELNHFERELKDSIKELLIQFYFYKDLIEATKDDTDNSIFSNYMKIRDSATRLENEIKDQVFDFINKLFVGDNENLNNFINLLESFLDKPISFINESTNTQFLFKNIDLTSVSSKNNIISSISNLQSLLAYFKREDKISFSPVRVEVYRLQLELFSTDSSSLIKTWSKLIKARNIYKQPKITDFIKIKNADEVVFIRNYDVQKRVKTPEDEVTLYELNQYAIKFIAEAVKIANEADISKKSIYIKEYFLPQYTPVELVKLCAELLKDSDNLPEQVDREIFVGGGYNTEYPEHGAKLCFSLYKYIHLILYPPIYIGGLQIRRSFSNGLAMIAHEAGHQVGNSFARVTNLISFQYESISILYQFIVIQEWKKKIIKDTTMTDLAKKLAITELNRRTQTREIFENLESGIIGIFEAMVISIVKDNHIGSGQRNNLILEAYNNSIGEFNKQIHGQKLSETIEEVAEQLLKYIPYLSQPSLYSLNYTVGAIQAEQLLRENPDSNISSLFHSMLFDSIIQ